jgi:hypothetical protein
VDAVGLIDVVNSDDVRVIQCRSSPGLLDEPTLPVGIGYLPGRKHLQGNKPVQASVTGLVDYAHPAFGKFFQDLVMPERLSDNVKVPPGPCVNPLIHQYDKA